MVASKLPDGDYMVYSSSRKEFLQHGKRRWGDVFGARVFTGKMQYHRLQQSDPAFAKLVRDNGCIFVTRFKAVQLHFRNRSLTDPRFRGQADYVPYVYAECFDGRGTKTGSDWILPIETVDMEFFPKLAARKFVKIYVASDGSVHEVLNEREF